MKRKKKTKPTKKDAFEKQDKRMENILICVIILIALGGLAMGYMMIRGL